MSTVILDGLATAVVPVDGRNGGNGVALDVGGRLTWEELQATWAEDLRRWRWNQATWADALERWLDVKEAKSRSSNTRRSYETAVRLFFEFCPKSPWAVAGKDVMDWQADMRRRELAETTINLRLSALSSFYSFCLKRVTLASPAGGDESLAVFNPVDRVERAEVDPYEKAHHLTPEQVRGMLTVIRRDMERPEISERSRLYAVRDFALITTYLYTGRRSSEIVTLQWGDIDEEKGRVFYHWGKERDVGKGQQRRDELPLPAWNAIVEYLEATGRLEAMEEDDYIFRALSDVAGRLPNVDEVKENRPLSRKMANRIVKKWARKAGLKWRKIRTHTLRHTAAMLRKEFTDDPTVIQDFLAHKNVATTMIYLKKKKTRTDDLWAQVETLIGLDGA